MTPKKPSQAFTSFRIIGKRAQNLLLRARKRIEQKERGQVHSDSETAEADNGPDIVVGFSLTNIMQATFVILAVIVGLWVVFQIQDKILLLLLGFFVAAIIDPGVRMMERMGIPRGIGILLQYFVALFILLFLLLSLIPIIAEQLQQIAILISEQVNAFLANPQISLPLLTDEVNRRLTDLAQGTLQDLSIQRFTDALQQLGEGMSSIAQGSLLFATRLAGSVVSFFVEMTFVLVFAFFIQMEREHLRSWFRSFFPARLRNYLDSKTDAVHHKIARWARGQILLGLTIGILVFIALTILGMPYAATLAVLAGFTEFIPYLGPFIAAVPAVLIAGTQRGIVWALIVLGVYYIIQWCENNFLVPLIMKRAVGLSPIAILFAILVGVSFPDFIHPVLGILLAVPATTILTLFIEDWRAYRQARHE